MLLALGALVFLVWLSGSFDGRDDGDRGITDTGALSNNSEATAAGSGTSVAGATPALGTLNTYIGGNEATPRTFNFEKLNFDSGQSTIRDADRAELQSLAQTLKQYVTSRIRVIGYADAQGAAPANAALAKARADTVKAALVALGIDGARIETGSDGENASVDSNQTTGGRFENRRTEVEVISR